MCYVSSYVVHAFEMLLSRFLPHTVTVMSEWDLPTPSLSHRRHTAQGFVFLLYIESFLRFRRAVFYIIIKEEDSGMCVCQKMENLNIKRISLSLMVIYAYRSSYIQKNISYIRGYCTEYPACQTHPPPSPMTGRWPLALYPV